MANIHLLDQELINKIAAGEVVERPASVVKELVENSLDAGATDILVEIEDGGRALIRISDNGRGMNAEDAQLALRRHATSKIQTLQDLQNIHTMGFRGEALAAISSVSQFRLLTRERDAVGATEVSIREGEVRMKDSAGKEGTMVEVKGLFDFVPARKKFLKAAQTEFKQIVDVVTRQALLAPSISFKLAHNGKPVLIYPAVTDWKSRIDSVLGPDLSRGMIELSHQRASLILHGFIGHPSVARERMAEQYLFVNKRAVSDYTIAKAVQQGYDTLIARGFKPAFVLQLSIAPDLVDVNVHPRKSEVKFADPSSVYREVYHAVKQALSDLVGNNPPKVSQAFSTSPPQDIGIHQSAVLFPPGRGKQENRLFPPSSAKEGEVAVLSQETAQVDDWKLIGQSHQCYLIVEEKDALIIIDQHAAAERVLLEKLLEQKNDTAVQKLLVPVVFELTAKQWAALQEQTEALSSLGIEGEEFGKQTFRLTGIPQDVDVKDLKTFFLDLLEELSESASSLKGSLDERRVKLAQMAACKAAVKFYQPLSREEQIQLLKDIRAYNAVACCHGRPTMYRMSLDELNAKFHRH